MSSEKLKDKLGHRLRRTWKEFKNHASEPTLAKFDSVIKELDKFESIRYPDMLLKKGASISFEIFKAGAAQFSSSGVFVPGYRLCLEEIDELVLAIFRIAQRNPKSFVGMLMRPEARDFLFRDNLSFSP